MDLDKITRIFSICIENGITMSVHPSVHVISLFKGDELPDHLRSSYYQGELSSYSDTSTTPFDVFEEKLLEFVNVKEL
jgi:hypothetical protein